MRSRISTAYFIVLLLLSGALGALYYFKAEWTPPDLTLAPDQSKTSGRPGAVPSGPHSGTQDDAPKRIAGTWLKEEKSSAD